MLKNLKSSCISVKFSQISALIGFIGFVAFCIYAALFKPAHRGTRYPVSL